MKAFLFAIAWATLPLPLDALRSFFCSPGYTFLQVTVATTEVIEIRSQTATSSMYYNNMNCTMLLSAPSSNDRIYVIFSAFSIRSPDTVTLYDGTKVLDGWPGAFGVVGSMYTTTLTSVLKMQMVTDSTGRNSGFIASAYVRPGFDPMPATALSQVTLPRSSPSSTSHSPSTPLSSVLSSKQSASSRTTATKPLTLSQTASVPPITNVSASSPVVNDSVPRSSGSVTSKALNYSSSYGSTSSLGVRSSFDTSAVPNPSSDCPSCTNRVLKSTSSEVSDFPKSTSVNADLSNPTTEAHSAPLEIPYSIVPTTFLRSDGHFVIKYIPGSQIPAFHISLPILLAYDDAPSSWLTGDFDPLITQMASILECDSDRIQNVVLQPSTRLQSELHVLILEPCDTNGMNASILAARLCKELQDPSSSLRKLDVLDYVPDPPVNITMKEILVTVCSNSTYTIGNCPGSTAQLESISNSHLKLSELAIWLAAGTAISVFIFIGYIRQRRWRHRWRNKHSMNIKSFQAINCEDSEPFQITQQPTKHRTNLSFALPNTNEDYQVKRTPYDVSLGFDEDQDPNYMRKRQGSFQSALDHGTISTME